MLLDLLIGAVVCEVRKEDDFLCIRFGDGEILAVYNRFLILPAPGEPSQLMSSVCKVLESREKVVLYFENKSFLEVGLRDEDYIGPEAMQIRYSDGRIMVFN